LPVSFFSWDKLQPGISQAIKEENSMMTPRFLKLTSLTVFLAAEICTTGRADDSEFHYVRPIGSRNVVWMPRSSFAVVGGQIYYFPTNTTAAPPTPNTWLSFRHPITHAYVNVPVALPNGVPRISQHPDRVVYNYGAVSVTIHFVHDGSVNVSYN
jgi:hypothetical protein